MKMRQLLLIIGGLVVLAIIVCVGTAVIRLTAKVNGSARAGPTSSTNGAAIGSRAEVSTK